MSYLEPQQTGKTVSLMHEGMKTLRQLAAENKELWCKIAIEYGHLWIINKECDKLCAILTKTISDRDAEISEINDAWRESVEMCAKLQAEIDYLRGNYPELCSNRTMI